jgi:hypothetical protein
MNFAVVFLAATPPPLPQLSQHLAFLSLSESFFSLNGRCILPIQGEGEGGILYKTTAKKRGSLSTYSLYDRQDGLHWTLLEIRSFI